MFQFTIFTQNHPNGHNPTIVQNLPIAGLAEATVVIESAEKGRSLITADLAFGYNQKFLHCMVASIILAVLLSSIYLK